MQQISTTLFAFSERIKRSTQDAFPESYWVTAEISELSVNRNGHCYMDLIEKSSADDRIIARVRATIWAYTFRMLKPYFETTAGRELSAGIKILIKVTVEYHELYGFSLNVKDIDPAYTLGDLVQKRREILQRLEKEGVIKMNREQYLYPVVRKVAIISSRTAAGYGDFVNQLDNNPYEYKFYCKLFEAYMQGDNAEASIVGALDRIAEYEDFFDVVVIIRGGGSQAELNCFDSYWLAYNICQFPLPVISGIGHQRDDTIVDKVAHTCVKTPTAAAEFLVSHLSNTENYLDELKDEFIQLISETLDAQQSLISAHQLEFTSLVKECISSRNSKLNSNVNRFGNITKKYIYSKQAEIVRLSSEINGRTNHLFLTAQKEHKQFVQLLNTSVLRYLERKSHQIELHQQASENFNPEKVLKRGYSIITIDGKVVKDASEIKLGDTIKSLLHKGEIESTVITKKSGKQQKRYV